MPEDTQTKKFDNLTEKAIEAGIPIAFHNSDLYLYIDEDSTKLLASYEYGDSKSIVSTFISNTDKRPMYEIAFGFNKETLDIAMAEGIYEDISADGESAKYVASLSHKRYTELPSFEELDLTELNDEPDNDLEDFIYPLKDDAYRMNMLDGIDWDNYDDFKVENVLWLKTHWLIDGTLDVDDMDEDHADYSDIKEEMKSIYNLVENYAKGMEDADLLDEAKKDENADWGKVNRYFDSIVTVATNDEKPEFVAFKTFGKKEALLEEKEKKKAPSPAKPRM